MIAPLTEEGDPHTLSRMQEASLSESDVPVPAPSPARPSMPLVSQDGDRFGVHVRPLPDGESQVSIVAAVDGVTYAEVVHHLVKALSALTRTPLAVVPTEAQLAQHAHRADVVAKHPAVRLFAKDGARLLLSEIGVRDVGRDIALLGWIDAGPVPDALGASPCDYMLDTQAFATLHLSTPSTTPEETEETNGVK